MGLSSRIKQLMAGVLEPFTSRRHRFYVQKFAELEGLVGPARSFRETGAIGGRSADWQIEALRVAFGRDIEALRASEAKLRQELSDLQNRVSREQNNLGMVAGGLEDLRQNIETFDLMKERFRAYETCLSDIAQRIDAMTEAPAIATSASEPVPAKKGSAVQGAQ